MPRLINILHIQSLSQYYCLFTDFGGNLTKLFGSSWLHITQWPQKLAGNTTYLEIMWQLYVYATACFQIYS